MATLDFEKPLVELETRLHALKQVIPQSNGKPSAKTSGLHAELRKLEERVQKVQRETYNNLTTWQRVMLSRHPDRPYFMDYLDRLMIDFVELHGDRRYSDDAAIICGFARFDGQSVAVVGQQKGRTTKEKLRRNFGMAHPDGYRKACRVMELAARYHRPIFTFIDTPGAYPGLGAEERGQSEAIGYALYVMAQLRVPVIATVLGEGGSGGALALGVANRVLMMEHSTYSVITPEGCASILWRDAARAPDAAEQLKMISHDVRKLGIVDAVVEEPLGGAHRDYDEAAHRLGQSLRFHLQSCQKMSADELIDDRYAKFRKLGVYATEYPQPT